MLLNEQPHDNHFINGFLLIEREYFLCPCSRCHLVLMTVIKAPVVIRLQHCKKNGQKPLAATPKITFKLWSLPATQAIIVGNQISLIYFLCAGKQCNIFHLKNQCNKRKPSDSFMQARVYLYDLYYHLPNYGLGKVLNSHDICIVAFQNFTK